MLIEIDQTQCRKVAEVLARVEIPRDREESQILGLTAEEVANFYFLAVAICHQTQVLRGTVDGEAVRGWDYLSKKLQAAVMLDKTVLDPRRWASMTAKLLGTLFADSQIGETLCDVAGRTELVQDLGTKMLAERWDSVAELYRSAGSRVGTGSPNLLGLIGRFHAYRDPVFKKTYFFLGLMSNSGLWQYVDPENVGAPVDYHEVRGHLRLGTVAIHDPQLRDKLFKGEQVSEQEDIAIRSAVHEAIARISELHENVNPMELHYLFWNILRSICLRGQPLCHRAQHSAFPVRYSPLLKIESVAERCPFASICPSADEDFRYVEHQFRTDWY
ncbi:MAG: hypothetical protein ACLQU1_00845 [Bryobacteraceae bacterium]